MTTRRLRQSDSSSTTAAMASKKGALTSFDNIGDTTSLPDKLPAATEKSKLTWFTAAASLIAGLGFGWFVQKANVYIPIVIFRQMKMEQFTMMKIFLMATATSQICVTLVSVLKRDKYEKVVSAFSGCLPKGVVSSGFGAAILGSGMAVCGACPGTVMVQVGAGLRYSGVVLAGGLVGTILYILAEPVLSYRMDPLGRPSTRKQFLTTWFDMPPWKIAFPMALCLVALVALVEVFLPYTIDYPYPEFYYDQSNASLSNRTAFAKVIVRPIPFLSDHTWPPYACGIAVGLLQLIIVFALQDTLGSSTGWVTLVAGVIHAVLPNTAKKSTYTMKSKDGLINVWQIIYYIGAIAAAALAALSSNLLINPNPPIESFSAVRSFFGGIMILFGSRLAGGCTSGHGISGLSLLNTMSLVAVPFMFAGGIFTAFAIDGFHYGQNYFRVPN